jgi:hypothetical protein
VPVKRPNAAGVLRYSDLERARPVTQDGPAEACDHLAPEPIAAAGRVWIRSQNERGFDPGATPAPESSA